MTATTAKLITEPEVDAYELPEWARDVARVACVKRDGPGIAGYMLTRQVPQLIHVSEDAGPPQRYYVSGRLLRIDPRPDGKYTLQLMLRQHANV